MSTKINYHITERGFAMGEFRDLYGQFCSIQESSWAGRTDYDKAIWLGVSNTGPNLKGPDGEFGSPVHARMHLSQKMAKRLIKQLKFFVKHGELPHE